MQKSFDVIVIGSGPGGEGASIKLAKAGKSVAVVEEHTLVGGGCTHWGTIPSKALIQVVRQYSSFRRSRLFGRMLHHMAISANGLLEIVEDIVARQVREREGFYVRNNIEVIQGRARFVAPKILEVDDGSGSPVALTAEHFVVSTGSHPYRPDDIDFSHPRVVDSDTILQIKELPETLTVYGAGVIGSEYASAFRNLGAKVNLVNTRSRLLEYLDDEISNALSYHMADEQGVLIRHNEEYERVEATDDAVILHLASGKKIKSDLLLWANGRSGNSKNLGLENIGVAPDHRGNISINEAYQIPSQPHIYAVGDIIGFPNLASAAFDQGRFAGIHITEGRCDEHLVRFIPTGIYTSPEISCIGLTEQELTEQQVPYEVGRAFFKNLARGQIADCQVGMLKLLFHSETLELLGIHCFGNHAAEILHIGQAIMSQPAPNNRITYFFNTTFNYPTMAEAYRVAAFNGYNRL